MTSYILVTVGTSFEISGLSVGMLKGKALLSVTLTCTDLFYRFYNGVFEF